MRDGKYALPAMINHFPPCNSRCKQVLSSFQERLGIQLKYHFASFKVIVFKVLYMYL